MKLTNYIRDAYVERALQDVPKPKDFHNIISDAVRGIFVAKLPTSVAKVWKDSKTRAYVATASFHGFGISVAVPSDQGQWNSLKESHVSDEERRTLKAIQVEWEADEAMRRALKDKLRAAAYGCTTRKALAELLPEFAHYLPAEDALAGRSLPVVANLVTDFVKAGWPKDKAGKKVKEAAHG